MGRRPWLWFALGVALMYILRLPLRLAEDRALESVNDQLSGNWRSWLDVAIPILLTWVVPITGSVVLLWVAYQVARWDLKVEMANIGIERTRRSWSPQLLLLSASRRIRNVFVSAALSNMGTPQGILFWPTRAQMSDETGGIDKELDDAVSAWASFEVGSYFLLMVQERQQKVQRLVLLHPECDLLQLWTRLDRSTGRAVETIRELTRKAEALEIKVRWSREPMLNAIFGNPDDPGAWVRIQSQLPYVAANYWPSYRVYKASQAALYAKAIEAYEAMWAKAEVPPKP